MYILENKKISPGKIYCYVSECRWDPIKKKYTTPSHAVGHLEGESMSFVSNSFLSHLLAEDPSLLNEYERLIITKVTEKYGEKICETTQKNTEQTGIKTARAVHMGPSLVFGGITRRYHLDTMLKMAFDEEIEAQILAMAWYIVSEGSALSNSDSWLACFENPAGAPMASQEITKLLNLMSYDGIMSFFKRWLAEFKKTGDRVLYDLTSISYSGSGQGINLASWGHNRDHEAFPQVNYALLCVRGTGMPLFAWPLDGSISDVSTLQTTLQFLNKLGYKPDCLMMDRGFDKMQNITYMLHNKHSFLQALKMNAGWVKDIVDHSRQTRLLPESRIEAGERVYYASTTQCRWVRLERVQRKGKVVEEIIVIPQAGKYKNTEEGSRILEQYACTMHVLFCQDLVGNQWDKFMKELGEEHVKLLADENTQPEKKYEKYFVIERKKYARKRTVVYNLEKIQAHHDVYAGHICFLTNDSTIATAEDALREYATRDYIEKDFDEMKNSLDMKRIRVHTDGRMRARLFIQFIAEIYLREIRVWLRDSEECSKMTKKQVMEHIKGIYKIEFKGRYKAIYPTLTKSQRNILHALKIKAPG
jgi:transposase